MRNTLQAIASIFLGTPDRAQGPDLSHWDGGFDPEKASQRVDFAFFKLTEGPFLVDSSINEIGAGVNKVAVRGGYHYQRSGFSWELQAEHFLQVASRFDLHIYALDLEGTNNVYSDTFFADTRRIITRWREKAPKKKILLYTNGDTYKQLYAAIVRLYPDGKQWMAELEFWFAWPSKLLNEPLLPTMRSAGSWRFWQKAWDGKPEEWGTESFADVNVFNGTREQLAEWLQLTTIPPIDPEPPDPPTPPEPQVEPITETTLFDAEVLPLKRIIVRTVPSVDDSSKTDLRVYGGELFKGHIWPGNEYLWIKISESKRPELIGKWVAVRKTDGSERLIILTSPQVVQPGMPQLYQVKHWIQMGPVPKLNAGTGAPEVFPMLDKHFTLFTKEWQLFTFELMALPARRWRACFTYQRVMTNDNGFDRPDDPRADYVNKLSIGSKDPKYASLLFGGNVITGREDGEWLWVETLDGRKAPPTVAWVKERPWLIQTFTNVTFSNGHVGNFPQGGGLPVVGPILTSRPVKFPLKNLKKLPLGSPIPDVYWP